MKTSDPILFDTNILIYNQNIKSEFYKESAKWHDLATSGEISAVIASQNFAEFANSMVNSKKVSKPLLPKVAALEIEKYLSLPECFTVIYPNNESLNYFNKFLAEFPKTGSPRRIFDLFLVATMLGNNIKRILTANAKDFASFPQIEVVRLVV